MGNTGFLWLLCLFALNCNIEASVPNEPLCVSLGSNCTAAFHMKNFNLRTLAYPFDWIFSMDIQGLFKILKNDFKDFFLNENLIDAGAAQIKDLAYNMIFVHDFPYHVTEMEGQKRPEIDPYWRDHYPRLKEKYMRRVERFKELKSVPESLVFFRYFHTSKTEAIELKSILDTYLFPKKSILVVVGNTQEYKDNWHLEDIKNFYFNAHSWASSSKGDHFIKICAELNIKISPLKQQHELDFFEIWF